MSVIARARVKENLIQFTQIPSVIEKLTSAGHFDLMFSLYNNIFITESCKDKDFAILMKENLKIISASIIEEVWQFHCNQLKLSQTSTPIQEKVAKLKEKITSSPRPHASPKISKRAASKSSSKLSHTESLSHLEIPVSRTISRDTSNLVLFTQSELSYTHSFMSKQGRRRLRSPNSSSQSSQLPNSRSPKHVIFPKESEKKLGVYPYHKGEFINISTK
jgi:hypothetical protein